MEALSIGAFRRWLLLIYIVILLIYGKAKISFSSVTLKVKFARNKDIYKV